MMTVFLLSLCPILQEAFRDLSLKWDLGLLLAWLPWHTLYKCTRDGEAKAGDWDRARGLIKIIKKAKSCLVSSNTSAQGHWLPFGGLCFTREKLLPSVPFLAIDMAGAILSVPAIEFGMMGDKILLIETSFFDTEVLSGYFILLPDVDGYSKILTSLGMGDISISG